MEDARWVAELYLDVVSADLELNHLQLYKSFCLNSYEIRHDGPLYVGRCGLYPTILVQPLHVVGSKLKPFLRTSHMSWLQNYALV